MSLTGTTAGTGALSWGPRLVLARCRPCSPASRVALGMAAALAVVLPLRHLRAVRRFGRLNLGGPQDLLIRQGFQNFFVFPMGPSADNR